MNAVTHVSGNIYTSKSAPLRALRHMFAFIGIHVAHPLADGSFLYRRGVWERYEAEVDFYQKIADSAFYIVYCDNEIDEQTSLQIMYAMLKRRPVIVTGEPMFSRSLSFFARTTISRHLNDFHSIHLDELELAELSLLLRTRRPRSYGFTDSEKVLIKACVRAHFRDIVAKPD